MNEPTNHSRSTAPAIHSRRDVLKGVGAALAGLALTATNPLTAGRVFASETLQTLTDPDILNFALTLEHLEATFYTQVVSGGQLSGDVLRYLTTIRDHENAHVNALTKVISGLGGTPVQRQNTYNFGDLSNQAAILQVAQNVEQVGVGAYTGAARLFSDKTTLLATAASIQQVESRHLGVINFLRGQSVAGKSYGPIFTANEVNTQVAPILGR